MPLILAGFFHVTKILNALVFQALKSCGLEGTGKKILGKIDVRARKCNFNVEAMLLRPGF